MDAFSGIVAAHPDPRFEDQVRLMVSVLPDNRNGATATFFEPACGLYLAWTAPTTEQSAAKLAVNRDRTVVLLLHDDGSPGDGREDGAGANGPGAATELVESYERVGSSFLSAMRGWPAGVLVDTCRRRVLIWADRYGLRRIYYHQGDEAFLFSTRARSLLHIRAELRQLDHASLAEYFALGCTLEQRSLFSRVSTLAGGSARVFERGMPVKQQVYFAPREWEEQSPLDASTFSRQFAEICSSVLPRYFRGRSRAALSLTGGVDSRLLLACHPLAPGSLPCYTFAGADDDTLDVRLARRLARAANQPHHVLRVGSDFLSKFPELAADTIYRTEGAFDVCGAHEIYLNRLAAGLAPVRVTGNFGSELFRAVRTLTPLSLSRDLFDVSFHRALLEVEQRFRSRSQGHPLSWTLFEEVPRMHYGCMTAAQSELDVRSPYLDPELAALLYRMPPELRNSPSVQLQVVADRRPAFLRVPTDSGLGANVAPALRPVQRFVSWASFKVDYRVMEGLPGPWARLDPVFVSLNPFRFFPGAHRFLQYRRWFRRELSEFVVDTLADRSTVERPYLDRQALRRLADQHAKGRRNCTQEINRVLTVELLQRLLIDRKPDRALSQQPVAVDPLTSQTAS